MSEAEMDAHTIRNMREQSIADGQPPKALVSLNPSDPLKTVIDKLFQNRCSVAPVLTRDVHGKANTSKMTTMSILDMSQKRCETACGYASFCFLLVIDNSYLHCYDPSKQRLPHAFEVFVRNVTCSMAKAC